MTRKICFKCKIEKELTDFYVHRQMGDGHLNKCKDCVKKYSNKLYAIQSLDENYIEKERIRGKLKYSKYKYKSSSRHIENSNTCRKVKLQGFNLAGLELHHWNYNNREDVFILNRKAHKLVHKYLSFDEISNMFKHDDQLITSKEEHYDIIKNIFNSNNVNYSIESYLIPF